MLPNELAALSLSLRTACVGSSSLAVFRKQIHRLSRLAQNNTSSRTFATVKDVPIEHLEAPTDGQKDMQHYKPAIARELFKALTVTPFQYSKPSPVQSAVFDLLPGLANPLEAKDEEAPRDLLVKAKTGTGKTIAFLLPALQARIRDLERQRAEHSDPPKDVRNALRYREKATSGALILSPTRELATQIANEASRMASHINGAKVQLFVGGASKVMQMKSWQHLRRDIIVATPGRMIDMIQSSSDIRDVLSKTRTLILDEADTLLDMGFKDDIERIMEHLPPKDERQTFLFSATVPSEIRQIARKALKPNHLFIDTVPPEEANVHLNIPQYATVLDNAKDQVPHILRLLAHDMLLHPDGGKAIVFLPTTRLTELFAQVIDSMKKYLPWGARRTIIYELHSKKSQASRDAAADRFRKASGGYHILVTSDVSARGVDYPNVTRVIQIGVPSSRDIYIHRVGRTGRAGKAGRGDIVLLDWEAGFLRSLKDLPIQKIGVQELTQEVEAMATEQDEAPQKPIAKDLHKQPNLKATTREIFSLRRSSTPGMVVSGPMQSDIHNRLTEIEAGVQEELFSSLDSYIVKEAFGSLLGYYMPRGADINARKMEMVDGLKGWAQQSMGLAEEPYVSEAMLKKMGASRERKSFDKRRDSFDRKPRGGFSSGRSRDSAPWMGRGRQSTRDSGRGSDRFSFRESRGDGDKDRPFPRRERSRDDYDRPARNDRSDRDRDAGREKWTTGRAPRLESYHDKEDRRPLGSSFMKKEGENGRRTSPSWL